ncbi:DUF1281 domain-containing protein [Pectobacterium carotovorum]|uniref:DUF1281 domain-containing protein n=1 Tax=Pectobacterium carotovorum TaxID=554 RepID=UPI0029DDD4A6|nr:DUF1281 domain-containing protein [Pectobacterium carotovorum]MDX6917759.1 DUF1281 domain-containing protein [Pectobacterium carotovorum]
MPNWCANRLYIKGDKAGIGELKALIRGERYPYHDGAIVRSIQLFLAGVAGILRPVDDAEYQPFPELVAAGGGGETVANRAFSEWLSLLSVNAELDELACEKISSLYEQSGIALLKWEDLTTEHHEKIAPIILKKHFDWMHGSFANAKAPETFWNGISEQLTGICASGLDLRFVLPTRLAVEINGFNGELLNGIQSSYNYYVWERYGVKWPSSIDVEEIGESEEFVAVDFDTAWSPPTESVFAALSEQYQCEIEHYYSEAGCDFCGFRMYSCGELIQLGDSSLEYAEEHEEGWSEVIGPEWILNNVAHFGG